MVYLKKKSLMLSTNSVIVKRMYVHAHIPYIHIYTQYTNTTQTLHKHSANTVPANTYTKGTYIQKNITVIVEKTYERFLYWNSYLKLPS